MIQSDSVRCFENFWSLARCFDLFVDKQKRAFSLDEKCRVTSWPLNFQLARIFFFAHCLCRNLFFRWTPLYELSFQTNIAFFWTVKSWFIIYVFVLYKLFYTHNRSKDTGHFNAKSFGNVHTVREEEATWSGRLIFIFLL